MHETLRELIEAYRSEFPQQVRDLAETFCSSTTRLGPVRETASRGLTDEMRDSAAAHGIRDEELAAALAQYVRIEALAESGRPDPG